MKTYTFRLRSNQESKLQIEIPADAANTEHDLVLVVQSVDNTPKTESEIPPAGSAARHIYEAQKANIGADSEIITTSKIKDILNHDFADDLLNRMKPDNDAK